MRPSFIIASSILPANVAVSLSKFNAGATAPTCDQGAAGRVGPWLAAVLAASSRLKPV